jgi:hypothetical protein
MRVAVGSTRLGSTRKPKSQLKKREKSTSLQDEYMASIATAAMRSGTGTDHIKP